MWSNLPAFTRNLVPSYIKEVEFLTFHTEIFLVLSVTYFQRFIATMAEEDLPTGLAVAGRQEEQITSSLAVTKFHRNSTENVLKFMKVYILLQNLIQEDGKKIAPSASTICHLSIFYLQKEIPKGVFIVERVGVGYLL